MPRGIGQRELQELDQAAVIPNRRRQVTKEPTTNKPKPKPEECRITERTVEQKPEAKSTQPGDGEQPEDTVVQEQTVLEPIEQTPAEKADRTPEKATWSWFAVVNASLVCDYV